MGMNAVYEGAGDCPEVIPLFPLSGALLLPRGQMPLNVFEPRYLAMIDDALAKGGKLVCGGKAESTLMPATLIDHVTPAMRIFHEESFGPVKGIVRVNSEEEAIATANDNEFGLSSAVFTRDTARGWRVAARIEAGICHINGPTVHDEAQMPFGGVKASGYGHFGGQQGINAFTETRWITMQTEARHYPF